MSTSISMHDLHELLEKLGKNELILDVREPDEYQEGHIPGSKNIPHEEVGKHTEELKKYDRIYIHCRSGKRSQMAFETLKNQGLKNLVCISNSGMKDWIQAGYKIQR
jgi:rhodanese-related sulfurtransferase